MIKTPGLGPRGGRCLPNCPVLSSSAATPGVARQQNAKIFRTKTIPVFQALRVQNAKNRVSEREGGEGDLTQAALMKHAAAAVIVSGDDAVGFGRRRPWPLENSLFPRPYFHLYIYIRFYGKVL